MNGADLRHIGTHSSMYQALADLKIQSVLALES